MYQTVTYLTIINGCFLIRHSPNKSLFIELVFQVAELEKKQKNFDKTLAEERAIAERNATERDAAEREAREKETRVLSLSREKDESSEKIEELERVKRQLQAELDELVNNQGMGFCIITQKLKLNLGFIFTFNGNIPHFQVQLIKMYMNLKRQSGHWNPSLLS